MAKLGRPSKYKPEDAPGAKVNVRNRAGVARGRRFSKLGVSDEFYQFMSDFQQGQCGICRRDRSEFKIGFAVDHCHDTGRVRGLLCANCNTGIGLLQDNRELLERAIRWLMTDEELGLIDG